MMLSLCTKVKSRQLLFQKHDSLETIIKPAKKQRCLPARRRPKCQKSSGGALWPLLARLWEPLGALVAALGILSGLLWALLGRPGPLLDCSWGDLGHSWRHLGPLRCTWVALGTLLGSFCRPNGNNVDPQVGQKTLSKLFRTSIAKTLTKTHRK